MATSTTENKIEEKVKVAKAKKPVAKTATPKPAKKSTTTYIETVGRRKTSTARVRLSEASKGSIIVNGKDVPSYFATLELQNIVNDAVEKSKVVGKFAVTVIVNGGGIHSQAEAIRHGLSRAFVEFDKESRTRLKKLGFLKRDPRVKERRKFGLKKARKAPQWSKR